jgi:hypothetical protein
LGGAELDEVALPNNAKRATAGEKFSPKPVFFGHSNRQLITLPTFNHPLLHAVLSAMSASS